MLKTLSEKVQKWLQMNFSQLNKKSMLYILGCSLAVVATASYFLKPTHNLNDYILVKKLYHSWQNGSEKDFEPLKKLLRKHKELETTYQGKIIQEEIIQGKKPSFALKKADDVFGKYSESTLLIQNGKYSEALVKTEGLRQEIITSGLKSSLLSLQTTLRLLSLAKELDDTIKEKEIINELMSMKDSALYKKMQEQFMQDGYDLDEYLSQREKILNLH